MNKKFKRILTASLITAASLTAVGCGTTNAKLAKNIDKGMADFVSSINNLDYVDTTSTTASNNKIGKIVETSNTISDQYLTKTLEELNHDNAITLPSERSDNFKLFTLSNIPYISFSSDDNSASINLSFNFSTAKLDESSAEINSNINNLILKRSILMIYVNEIYNNRVNLSEQDRVAINAYVNVIKENASFLKGNRGMVKNQLSLASDLISDKSNDNLVNYYIIKSGEALETRSSKIDATISAIDSIINIIESNLTSDSLYYKTNLSETYEDIISNLNNSTIQNTTTSENKILADNISNSLNLTKPTSNLNNNDEFKIGNISNQVNKESTKTLTNQTNKNPTQTTKNTNQKNNQNYLNNQAKTLELNKRTEISEYQQQTDSNQKNNQLNNFGQKNNVNNLQNNNISHSNISNNKYNNSMNYSTMQNQRNSTLNKINDQKLNNVECENGNCPPSNSQKSLTNSTNSNQVYSNSQNNRRYNQINDINMINKNNHTNREKIKTVPYIQNLD